MHRKAISHLRAADPALGEVITRVGPYKLVPRAEGTHFDHVVRSIVGQQLSGAAARTIYKRVLDLKGGKYPTPADFLKFPVPTLRAAGLSGRKVEYVKELAKRTHDGSLAILRIHEMDDSGVMETLVSVRGIGPWTAQMVLMFRLGRPDIFPELDLGVQKAVQKLRRMRKLPTPKQMTKIGATYAPYRTCAAWYLWRSLELPEA
ncbi:MAG: DNA-3-methyladenine glycosylase family protein [Gemmatimonadaceae bacterium]